MVGYTMIQLGVSQVTAWVPPLFLLSETEAHVTIRGTFVPLGMLYFFSTSTTLQVNRTPDGDL